jgi:hypothetical protein
MGAWAKAIGARAMSATLANRSILDGHLLMDFSFIRFVSGDRVLIEYQLVCDETDSNSRRVFAGIRLQEPPAELKRLLAILWKLLQAPFCFCFSTEGRRNIFGIILELQSIVDVKGLGRGSPQYAIHRELGVLHTLFIAPLLHAFGGDVHGIDKP